MIKFAFFVNSRISFYRFKVETQRARNSIAQCHRRKKSGQLSPLPEMRGVRSAAHIPSPQEVTEDRSDLHKLQRPLRCQRIQVHPGSQTSQADQTSHASQTRDSTRSCSQTTSGDNQSQTMRSELRSSSSRISQDKSDLGCSPSNAIHPCDDRYSFCLNLFSKATFLLLLFLLSFPIGV